MKYTEKQMAEAIEELYEALLVEDPWKATELLNKHPCIEEIHQFGPNGPCGQGLGRFGGHAP